VNYLPGTAGAVSAHAALGDDLTKDCIRRGLVWIAARQNADGGFGETTDSYQDPSLAGCGPTTAALTGSVLLGLVDGGEASGISAARAAAYLCEHQRADGSWANGEHVATLVPPKLFYEYGGAARYIPLEALGCYRAKLSAEQTTFGS
jgi:squalene-hopene/tetraprenyl-beta-curcumene cyclase